jgi:ABC-type sugar transport system substrate-binding protein
VVLASGFEHITIHQQTSRGFIKTCKEFPLNLLTTLYNKDNEQVAYSNTNILLKQHPDIMGIYVNSHNSSGVIRSVREHGLGGKVILITSDINDELCKCLEDGTVTATVFQNQYRQGRLALRYLYQHISENLEIEDTITVNPELIFRSNMHRYQQWR